MIIGLNPAADDLDSIVRLEGLLEQVDRRLSQRALLPVGDRQAARGAEAHVARGGMVGLDVEGSSIWLAVRPLALRDRAGIGSDQRVVEGVEMITLEARTYG